MSKGIRQEAAMLISVYFGGFVCAHCRILMMLVLGMVFTVLVGTILYLWRQLYHRGDFALSLFICPLFLLVVYSLLVALNQLVSIRYYYDRGS